MDDKQPGMAAAQSRRAAEDRRHYNSGPMRILVVEDDPRMASLFSRALRETGYAVDVVADGRGPSSRDCGSHDLVVLDILLPGKNGFDVCRELRADRPRPRS